jgi:hypothetical protein
VDEERNLLIFLKVEKIPLVKVSNLLHVASITVLKNICKQFFATSGMLG